MSGINRRLELVGLSVDGTGLSAAEHAAASASRSHVDDSFEARKVAFVRRIAKDMEGMRPQPDPRYHRIGNRVITVALLHIVSAGETVHHLVPPEEYPEPLATS